MKNKPIVLYVNPIFILLLDKIQNKFVFHLTLHILHNVLLQSHIVYLALIVINATNAKKVFKYNLDNVNHKYVLWLIVLFVWVLTIFNVHNVGLVILWQVIYFVLTCNQKYNAIFLIAFNAIQATPVVNAPMDFPSIMDNVYQIIVMFKTVIIVQPHKFAKSVIKTIS